MWMNDFHQTDAELACWIEKYLIFQGTWSFTSLVMASGGGSLQLLTAAASQDLIGGTEFLPRKVSIYIEHIQNVHCALSPCRIMGMDWMRSFVSHLMQISHAQWILQSFTLHDKQRRYLHLQQHRDLLREVDAMLNTPPEKVPKGSWHLLEIDFLILYNTTFERQPYWVLVMKATRQARRRIVQSTQRKGGAMQRHAEAQRKPAEILGDPYSKKSPLLSIGNFPCLTNSPKLFSYQALGQSRVQ
jgi:hypothetical protein